MVRDHIFHLAIPVYDLHEAQHFYVTQLGCKLARSYPDRITLDFFGDQVVCHLSEPGRGDDDRGGIHRGDADRDHTGHGGTGPGEQPLSLYPRHFGVTFRRAKEFDLLYELAQLRKIRFFADVSTRFDGTPEVHRTFVLRDPFDNLLEFKHYRDARMAY